MEFTQDRIVGEIEKIVKEDNKMKYVDILEIIVMIFIAENLFLIPFILYHL